MASKSRCLLIAHVAAMSLVLIVGEASAQEAPVMPLDSAIAAPDDAPHVPSPARDVRVLIRSADGNGPMHVAVRRDDGLLDFPCTNELTCTVDAPRGGEIRITLGRDRTVFVVPNDADHRLTLEVSAAPKKTAIAMIGVGGGVAAGSLAFAAANVYAITPALGYAILGVCSVGAATAAIGVVWLMFRSREPRVVIEPGFGSRTGPGDRSANGPRALAPLSYGFTF